MEELDPLRRTGFYDGVVDPAPEGHRTHGDGPVGERLGHGDDVGGHSERLGGESAPGATKACYDLIENQQDPAGGGDLGQAFQVPFGGTSTPVEPDMGSTMTAAMLLAP